MMRPAAQIAPLGRVSLESRDRDAREDFLSQNCIAIVTWQLCLIGAGLLISCGSVLSALIYRRRLHRPRLSQAAAVTLVMALTGPARNLPRLLRALEHQTLRPRRLIIAVESEADPAAGAARSAGERNFPLEVVVAGLAERSAQKCSNLLEALRRIDGRDDVVIFMDGDIVPGPAWLAALATPLMGGTHDLVTGYRWPAASGNQLGTHLILAIDRGVAVLPRPRSLGLVWGGSVGIRREVLETLSLRTPLGQTLSDDLTLGTLATQAGLRILHRRALLVPTPLNLDCVAAWRFGHRQYQMIRLYRPALWALALLLLLLQTACWSAILTDIATSTTAQLAGATLVGLALAKQTIVADIGRLTECEDTLTTAVLQLGLCLAKPAVDVFHLSMVLGAARVRSVTWAHIRYRVRSPLDIAVLSRRPWSRPAS
jgi:hypothetical protein